MKPRLLVSLLLAAAFFVTLSCSKAPFNVVSLEVPAGPDFSFCLDKTPPVPKVPKTAYYYAVTFITKDRFRYVTEGLLANAATGTDNCYSAHKQQYNAVSYTDETIRRIENISTANLDTCFVQVFNDPFFNEDNLVTEKVFTAEDFN